MKTSIYTIKSMFHEDDEKLSQGEFQPQIHRV